MAQRGLQNRAPRRARHWAWPAAALSAVSVLAFAPAAAWADPEPAPIPPAPSGEVLRPPPAAPLPPAAPPPAVLRSADAPPASAPAPDPTAVATQSNVHGIGVAGSFATGSGLTYRHYWGNSSLQLAMLAIITDRGNEAVAFVGGSFVQYLLVWNAPGSRGLLPTTSALRVLGGAHYYLSRGVETTTTEPAQGVIIPTSIQKSKSSLNMGAGLGFEFGAIVRSGFSLSLDLVLTAAFDKQGLDYILPLPQGALVYSW